MRIYRVEYPHPGGGHIGPYNAPPQAVKGSQDFFISMWIAHSCDKLNHPPMHGPWGTSSGVLSMRDLFSWFGGYIPGLLKAGGRVGVYEVEPEDIYDQDGLQVLFWRETSIDVTKS